MKVLLSILLITIYIPSLANGVDDLLNSSSFEKICSKTIKSQLVKLPGTDEVRQGYVTTRPVFSESKNYLFTAMKDLNSNFSNYTVTMNKKEANSKAIKVASYRRPIKDMIAVSDEQLLLLFKDHLLLQSLNETESIKINIPKPLSFGKNDHAYSMVLMNNIVYIANGTMGVTKVDLVTEEISNIDLGLMQDDGHLSIAVSISVANNTSLLVGVDNLSMPKRKTFPFNGFKKVDLFTNQVFSYPYNKRTSGVLVRVARTIFADDTLWINNWGTIQTIGLNKLNKEKPIRASWFKTTIKDKSGEWHYQPIGDFFIQGDHFYSCAKKTDMKAGSQIKDKSVVFKFKIK